MVIVVFMIIIDYIWQANWLFWHTQINVLSVILYHPASGVMYAPYLPGGLITSNVQVIDLPAASVRANSLYFVNVSVSSNKLSRGPQVMLRNAILIDFSESTSSPVSAVCSSNHWANYISWLVLWVFVLWKLSFVDLHKLWSVSIHRGRFWRHCLIIDHVVICSVFEGFICSRCDDNGVGVLLPKANSTSRWSEICIHGQSDLILDQI
jgi:hypothetical protein